MIMLFRVLVVMYLLLVAFTFKKKKIEIIKKGLKMWSQDMFKGVKYFIALIVIVSVLIGYGIGKII